MESGCRWYRLSAIADSQQNEIPEGSFTLSAHSLRRSIF
jgi:hypothetical protein